MKYSVSNWICGSEPIERTVVQLSKFGYDGIEIKGEPNEYDVRSQLDPTVLDLYTEECIIQLKYLEKVG